MRLIGAETKVQFRQRLEAEGKWPKFIAARERLKRDGTATGWNAWLLAAAQGNFLEERMPNAGRRIVDMLIVVGPAETPKARRLLAACQRCSFPCVALAGWESFNPAMIEGRAFPGVTPADPEFDAAARDFHSRLKELTVAGWVDDEGCGWVE